MIGQKKRKPVASAGGGSNLKRLARRVVVEVVMLVLVGGVFIGGALVMVGVADSERKAAEQAESEKRQMNSKLLALKDQIEQLGDALPLSDSVIDAQGNSRLALSRDEAAAIFYKLKEEYVFEEINVVISPISKPEDEKLNKQYVRAISSTITISMKAYHDEQVVRFIQEVQKTLPGIVSVESVDISRGSAYSLNEEGQNVGRITSEPQISARLELLWYGFEIKQPDDTQAQGGG